MTVLDPSPRSSPPAPVGASALAVAGFLTAASLLYLHTAFSGGAFLPKCACGDQVQEAWFLHWPLVATTRALNPFFTDWMNVPTGTNLAVNTSAPLLGAVSIPLQLTVGPLATYNLLLPLSMAASAASLYFVLRRWLPNPWLRFVAGLLYGFSPYMVGQGAGHVFLTAAFVPPLVLWVGSNLLDGRWSPRRSGLTLGGLAVAQYLISPEVLAMTVVFGVIGLIVLALANPVAVRTAVRPVARAGVYAVGLGAVLLAYPVWFTLAGPQHISGPIHAVSDLSRYSGDLLGPVIPTSSQRLATAALRARGNALTEHSTVENGLYLGVPLLLAVVGLTVRYRRTRTLWFFATMTVCAFVLSLGPRLTVDGTVTGAPLPFALLLHVPLVQDIESARISLFTQLFAAIWLALGLGCLASDLRSGVARPHRTPRRWLPATATTALAVVALVPVVPRGPISGAPVDTPAFYTSPAVRHIPPASVVLAYPYPTAATTQSLLGQVQSGLRYKVVGGYAFIPTPGGGSGLDPHVLPPPSVQAVFYNAYRPVPGWTPRQLAEYPPLDGNMLGTLRTFLVRYRIGTVVIDPIGRNPAAVVRFVTAVLGPPARTDGTMVWFDVAARLARSGT